MDDDIFASAPADSVPTMEPAAAAAWVPIDGSTNVAAVIFWGDGGPGGASLGVRFHSGREYHYRGVHRAVYDWLLRTVSKGHTHWELLRRRGYVFRRIR